jgi:hypothetical protein
MNCLEFHRAKLADPRRLSPEARSHAAQCAACGAFAASVDDAERDLERAAAVAVPEGLADRVLLRVQGGRRAWRPWALAASVLLALGIGAAVLLQEPASGAQARLAIQHVAAEPESFSMLQPNPRELDELVRLAGGRLKQPLGAVRYVKLCPVDNGTGWHIVLETPEGLATLFLVAGQKLAAPQRASSGEWNALAQPTASGYYAVVTPSAQKTAYVERMIRERIEWNT